MNSSVLRRVSNGTREKKAKGLGRGLDALFGDVEINLEPEVKEESIKKYKNGDRYE